MTAIIGVKCKDGIVIGADSRVTRNLGEFGPIHDLVDKIELFEGHNIIFVGAGLQHLIDRYVDLVKDVLENEETDKDDHRKFIRSIIEEAEVEFKYVDRGKDNILPVEVLLAFNSKNRPYLCHIYEDFDYKFVGNVPPSIALGLGKDGLTVFFEQMHKILINEGETLDVSAAQFCVYWSFSNLTTLAPSSYEKTKIVSLIYNENEQEWSVGRLSTSQLNEQELHIKKIRNGMASSFRENFRSSGVSDLPEIKNS